MNEVEEKQSEKIRETRMQMNMEIDQDKNIKVMKM